MKVWQGPLVGWGRVPPPGSAVSIGVFDGVHRGHQQVLRELVKSATDQGLLAVAVTFDRHPLELVAPQRVPLMLTTVPQRLPIFEYLGIDLVGVLPFNEVRQFSPDRFAELVLAEILSAQTVAVGADFRYGLNRRGNVESLQSEGERLGFEVKAVDLLTEHDGVLSSSRIRRLLAGGQVELATEALGRFYELAGVVVGGDRRGRVIGIPTANLEMAVGMARPGNGVYAAWSTVDDRTWPAVVNIGTRPTFGGGAVTVEAHLLDFEGDLYGKNMGLRFVKRLRDEESFDSVQDLVAQIRRDIEEGREVLR